MSHSTSLSIAARFLFPVVGPPIPDGRIVIRNGLIVELGARNGASVDLLAGNVAITPGFVNAHTHLELDTFADDPKTPIDERPPERQLDWMRRMIASRRGLSLEGLRQNVATNVRESIRSGTTCVADLSTAGLSWDCVVGSPLRGIVYAEILGLKRARAMETSEAAWEWLGKVREREPESNARVRSGLSPHAPYSTAGWLYERAATARVPMTTHLAEMPEEEYFLATGEGGLRDFLESINAWDDDWEPLGDRPADYIRKRDLRQMDWIIAHGNYLDESDFWQLRPQAAPDGQRVAVAYCPRTHARFGHAPHPYLKMIQRGVTVCLGTDSLASAPSLSVLDEIRFLRRRDPSTPSPLILAMATTFGAWAMRLEQVCGSLTPGKAADLAFVQLPHRNAEDPHDLLFDSDLPVVATMFGGEFVHAPGRFGKTIDA